MILFYGTYNIRWPVFRLVEYFSYILSEYADAYQYESSPRKRWPSERSSFLWCIGRRLRSVFGCLLVLCEASHNTIKDLKYFKADRMSCNAYRANYFRLFIYSAAFVLAHNMKHTLFMGTQVESFTMDSLIKRIMLSAVFIEQKKTFIKVSFSPHHRHLEDITIAFSRMAA